MGLLTFLRPTSRHQARIVRLHFHYPNSNSTDHPIDLHFLRNYSSHARTPSSGAQIRGVSEFCVEDRDIYVADLLYRVVLSGE